LPISVIATSMWREWIWSASPSLAIARAEWGQQDLLAHVRLLSGVVLEELRRRVKGDYLAQGG
jgi:hypothetical protein